MNKQMSLKSFIEGLPKAELHLHIEGTLEPELMFAIARRNNIDAFFDEYGSIEELKTAYDFKGLNDFLDVYYKGVKVLKTERDFYDLTFAYLKKAHSQSVLHTEIFFDPQAHTDRKQVEDQVDFKTVITGIHRALVNAEEKMKISTGLILCFLRHLDPDLATKTLEEALQYKSWIVAVGLDSYESEHAPEKFKEVFKRAREEGFRTVAHAGEVEPTEKRLRKVRPTEYIWQAIEELHVSRIDHGILSLKDEKLVKVLKNKKIPLTVCPLSNLKIGIVERMEIHPLKEMIDKGLRVTINSDDPAYFGGYINENYLAAQRAFRFRKEDLCKFAKNSFEASFLDGTEIEKMIEKLDGYMNRNA